MGGWRVRVVLAALLLSMVGPGVLRSVGAQEPTPLDGTPRCGQALPTRPAVFRPPAGAIDVGTFNVLHSDTDEGDRTLAARLPLEARAIAEAGLDVVGIQEAAANNTFEPGNEYPQKHGVVAERLAQQLAKLTGHRWMWCWSQSNPHVPLTPDTNTGGGNPIDDVAAQFGNTPDPGDFREGLAIVTRYEIVASRFHRLLPRSYEAAACAEPDPFCPLSAAFDSRQVLWAHVKRPDGTLFDMFTTHIAHHVTALSDTTKLLQVQQAIDVVDSWSTSDRWPDFLVGDFNSDPSTDRYDLLIDEGFADTYRDGGGIECTAFGDAGCSGGPRDGEESYTPTSRRGMSERIDYVFARGSGSCDVASHRVATVGDRAQRQPDGRWLWPSDHLGMRATVSC